MTYGEVIKRSREARCWTQEQLAESLGVSRQAVSKWEANLSRPARSKLERLSEILEVPPETWTTIDAEQAAAELPPDRSRPWKIAAGVLAAACIALTITLTAVLWRQAHPSTAVEVIPSEDAAADDQTQADAPASLVQLFPESLPLNVRHDFDFGDVPLGDYDPARVPFLEDNLEIQEQEVWEGCLGGGDGIPPVYLSVVKTNPVQENHTTFYDVYLLYAYPDSDGSLDWNILTGLVDYNHYINREDGFRAEEFTNVLGHSGYKLSILVGASAGALDFYIIQRPDGSPALMTIGNDAREFDVDEDGVLEIVSVSGNPWNYCEITDTREGKEGAFVHMLDIYDSGYANIGLDFQPEKGGFVVTDSQNAVMVRYVLRGSELVRQPLTDFTAADWPDVAGSKLTFTTEPGLSDEHGPDDVLYSGSTRITHRQQAYLALQELYNLTGIKIEECYYSGSETGVHFSLLPDGTNARNFLSAWYGENYGGGCIPSLYLTWKELGNDWSPLSLEEAARPESWVPEENRFRWYYDRLKVFRTGEPAIETYGAFPEERRLYLENGDLFVGWFEDTEWGPVLTHFIGPYPDGEINH